MLSLQCLTRHARCVRTARSHPESMLQLFYSNRYETLVGALLDDLAQAPSDPWTAQP